MTTLPPLPALPRFGSQQLADFFAPIGGGVATPGGSGPAYGVPGVILAPGSTPSGTPTQPTGSGSGALGSAASAVAGWFTGSLLRLALFLLGLICVIGAIYLYGSGQQTPADVLRGAARGAVRTGKRAAAALMEE